MLSPQKPPSGAKQRAKGLPQRVPGKPKRASRKGESILESNSQGVGHQGKIEKEFPQKMALSG